MAIQSRNGRWQVRVSVKGIRESHTVDSLEEARSVERAMKDALRVYGKWPVLPDDKPMRPKVRGAAPTLVSTPSLSGYTVHQAVEMTFEVHYADMPSAHVYRAICNRIVSGLGANRLLADIKTADLDVLKRLWLDDGLASSTVLHYLSTLRVVFRTCAARSDQTGIYHDAIPLVPGLKVRRAPRWWLTPDLHKAALEYCDKASDHLLGDYIEWTVHTGLRVQETLRCRRHHFSGLTTEHPMITVPGTKTGDAEVTLPLGTVPSLIAYHRLSKHSALFPVPEHDMRARWNRCRSALGLEDVPTATLKSLRRTFARFATDSGMPAPVLQGYMRHGDIKTTKKYLELVGGWGSEDMRRFLK